MKYRRLRPLPASGRLALSLVCAVAATLAAGLAFLAGAVALGSTACGTAVISLALAAIQWRTMRATAAEDDGDEITIDLRNPLPRLSTNDPVTGLVDKTYFRVTLSQRVASARRHLQPLSLVVFELDGFERARPERRDQALRLLGSAPSGSATPPAATATPPWPPSSRTRPKQAPPPPPNGCARR